MDETESKNFISKDRINQEFAEYKKFAYGKNLFAMALTLILATSIQKFVTIISETILMPIINYMVSTTGGKWNDLIFVPIKGLEIEIGKFTNGFLEFSVTTFCLYLLYSKVIKRISPEFTIGAEK
jgi:large-conductance mechanosensitive channel